MKPKTFMLIAGEASGDALAAELVDALRREMTAAEISYTPDLQPLETGLQPRFFGAGGPRMKAAGVELVFDLTQDSLIGVPGPKKYFHFRRLFNELLQLALDRQPDAIIGVDFNYFNLRFAHAIRQCASPADWFHDWKPKLVKYISPQVWASREGRVHQLARDFDLLVSIFPFEKEWYAKRAPKLRVEFVGHPMVERFALEGRNKPDGRVTRVPDVETRTSRVHPPEILLLPGSRESELRQHVPVVLDALKLIQSKLPVVKAKMVLPDDTLAKMAKSLGADLEMQIGNLSEALADATLAISKTGTVTMECALAGVPTVTFYKTSWWTYQLAKNVFRVKVKSLTMPNLLAGEEIFPEFIQDAATPENISRAALELLSDETRRRKLESRLTGITSSLGTTGAPRRAARAIVDLLQGRS